MQTPLSLFQRRQLEVLARVTPHSMAAHILNTTVLGRRNGRPRLATAQLVICAPTPMRLRCLCSIVTGETAREFHAVFSERRGEQRSTHASWHCHGPSWPSCIWGNLAHDQELILIALTAGMAASGTILLSALPGAAFSYMSGILIPSALKSLLFLNAKGYLLLGVLVLSYWWFLAALIAKVAREIGERKRIDIALQESEVRLQQTLRAGQRWSPSHGIQNGLVAAQRERL